MAVHLFMNHFIMHAPDSNPHANPNGNPHANLLATLVTPHVTYFRNYVHCSQNFYLGFIFHLTVLINPIKSFLKPIILRKIDEFLKFDNNHISFH
jgi:hypothetical protein